VDHAQAQHHLAGMQPNRCHRLPLCTTTTASVKLTVYMLSRSLALSHQIRYRRSTFAQTLFGPILFLFLLWLLQKADTARQLRSNYHPDPWTLPGIDNCQVRNEGDTAFILHVFVAVQTMVRSTLNPSEMSVVHTFPKLTPHNIFLTFDRVSALAIPVSMSCSLLTHPRSERSSPLSTTGTKSVSHP
jgi:hypothetical protein